MLEPLRTETLRSARFNDGRTRWTVRVKDADYLSAAPTLGLEVLEDGKLVYAERGFRASPLHCEDSLATLLSFVALACHDALYDDNGDRLSPEWDTNGLDSSRAMREEAGR